MSATCSDAPRNAGAFRAGEWLSLAAAPTCAVMALLTSVADESAPAFMCAHGTSFGGMAAMYGLMSAFHLAPWLKLIFGR